MISACSHRSRQDCCFVTVVRRNIISRGCSNHTRLYPLPQATRHSRGLSIENPTTAAKNMSHVAGPAKNRRTTVSAGLVIRAHATNNRRRSVVRAELKSLYEAAGFYARARNGDFGSVLPASHTRQSRRAGVRGRSRVAACC